MDIHPFLPQEGYFWRALWVFLLHVCNEHHYKLMNSMHQHLFIPSLCRDHYQLAQHPAGTSQFLTLTSLDMVALHTCFYPRERLLLSVYHTNAGWLCGTYFFIVNFFFHFWQPLYQAVYLPNNYRGRRHLELFEGTRMIWRLLITVNDFYVLLYRFTFV